MPIKPPHAPPAAPAASESTDDDVPSKGPRPASDVDMLLGHLS